MKIWFPAQLTAVAFLLIGAFGISTWLLWHNFVIELPPIAVRGIGQVAGLMSVRSATTVQLPIAFHRQEHSLSCEVATLKMALSAFDINVPESELLRYLPFDSTAKGGGVWGDPNKGFVGDIDGKMLVDGYGVYWDPIARLGLRWKRTEVLRGASATDVAEHLESGRPVIIWGYFGRLKTYTWKSATGAPVNAVNGEHTRIVTGFSGEVDNPTSFSLIDPIFGPMSWSTKEFMNNWGSLGRNAVVVYPHPRWVRAAGTGRVWEISEDGTERRWIRTWQTFADRGGYKEAIVLIDQEELSQYARAADITS